MPVLIQGVKDIVDKNDEPPEPSTSENGEGEGLEGWICSSVTVK